VKNPKTFWKRTMLECIVAWPLGGYFLSRNIFNYGMS
jgi:hypothetical protein